MAATFFRPLGGPLWISLISQWCYVYKSVVAAKAAMTQQFLYRIQIGPLFIKCVAKVYSVHADFFINGGNLAEVIIYNVIYISRISLILCCLQ